MRKPEFSRPFNILDAKAGAPYCCRDGRTAQVLKWDRNVSDYPMMGVVGKSDDPRTWTATGSATYGAHGEEYDCDLVMLPLGFIDGKPVFMGDELITRFGDKFVVEAKHIGDLDEENTWPPSYPVTQMRLEDFDAAIIASGSKECISASAACAIANAALRHAIDNGYLLDPREMPQTISIKASPEDVQRIMSGDTGRESIQYVPTNDPARDVERDLAIAEAAAKAVYNKVYQFGSHRVAYCDLRLDLPAIISSVTGAKDAKEGAK